MAHSQLAGGQDGESGFALVAVLWFLVLVSAVVASFALAARADFLISSNARQKLRLDMMADNVATTLSLRLSAAGYGALKDDIRLDSTLYSCSSERYAANLRIQDQAGLIDLNAADEKLLTVGLRALGLTASDNTAIAKEIINSRSYQPLVQPGQPDVVIIGGRKAGPFESVIELSDIEFLDQFEPADLHRVFTVQSRQPFVLLSHSPRTLAESLVGQQAGVEHRRDPGDIKALALEVTVEDRSSAIRGYAGYLIERSESAGRVYKRTEPLFEPAFHTDTDQKDDCPSSVRNQIASLLADAA
jgi:general secretion pathway protein K